MEAILERKAEAVTQKAVDLALTGDMTALRLCLDQILPPRKDRPMSFELPLITSAKGAAAVVSSVLAAVAAGELTPEDPAEVGGGFRSIEGVTFAKGDKVICADWFDDSRRSSAAMLRSAEPGYVTYRDEPICRTIDRVAANAKAERDPGFAPFPALTRGRFEAGDGP